MNIKDTVLRCLDIGVKENEKKDIVFRIRILNLDAIFGILIPTIILLIHYTGLLVFNQLLVNILFSFPVVCSVALWFNSRYQYNISSTLILGYFLIVIPLLSFWLGEKAHLHFLLIAVSISGFIYLLEARSVSFLFFVAYMGMFLLLYMFDFIPFFLLFFLDSYVMNFVGK
ncbi:MAG: hypothetical protein AB8B69_22015 [Chitinophagales bacterium]